MEASQTQSKSDGALNIKIMGVGAAGINILNEFAAEKIGQATTAAIDTDTQALKESNADVKIKLGKDDSTRYGTGGDLAVGKEVAIAAANQFEDFVKDADILFLTGALGGGTATMSIPMISKIAAENKNTTVISFCILPLSIEGEEKKTVALSALKYLRKRSNATVELPNDIILARSCLPMAEAFAEANRHASRAMACIIKMLTKKGVINVDAASFRKVFSERARRTLFANATSEGVNCVTEAVEKLKESPFVKSGNQKAESLLINVTCPRKFEMNKMQQILESVSENFSMGQKVVFGANAADNFENKLELSIIGVLPAESVEETETQQTNSAEKNLENKTNNSAKISDGTDRAESENDGEQDAPNSPSPARMTGKEDDKVPERESAKSRFFKSRKKLPTEPEKVESPQTENPADPLQQREFTFVEKNQQRGFFEDTLPTMHNGEDLDVPTFMRRNIKIQL